MHNFQSLFCTLRQENSKRNRFQRYPFQSGLKNHDFSAFYRQFKGWYTHANEREPPDGYTGQRLPVNKANNTGGST